MEAEAGGLLQIWVVGKRSFTKWDNVSKLVQNLKKKNCFSSLEASHLKSVSLSKMKVLGIAHLCETLSRVYCLDVSDFVMLVSLVCNLIRVREMSSFLIRFFSSSFFFFVLILGKGKFPLYLGPGQDCHLWTNIPRKKPCLQRLTS